MINQFIAVVAVFTIVNGLVIILLNKLSLNLKNEARKAFVVKLNIFDEIIDSKISEIKALESRIKSLSEDKRVTRNISKKSLDSNNYSVSAIKSVDYKDISFFDNYNYLKYKFNLDYESILNLFIEDVLNKNNNETINTYLSIIEKLDFDVRYNILMKTPKEQIDFLKNKLFDLQESSVIDKYMEDKIDFDFINFYSYIKEQTLIYENKATVILSKDLANLSKMDDRIEFVVDDKILEGIKIMYKNKIYDYSFGRKNGKL